MQIELVEQDGAVVSIRVVDGNLVVAVMGNVHLEGDRIIATQVHIEGPGAWSAGWAWMRNVALTMMEKFDADEIRIEGARRTSGANPGRIPRPRTVRRLR